ncbi:MAG: primosomal protein N' (replication factor Y) - superfamily II helicase [Pseudomonadota bacterium]
MAIGPWGKRKAAAAEAEPPPPQDSGEVRFDCESCGASLKFTPGSSSVTCDHCGHVNEIPDESAPIEEIDFRATLATLAEGAETSETRVIQCQSCGAEFSLPPDSHSGACPYCGSDVVTDTGAERQIKPAALVPFELDREAARKALKTWLKGLWFAPNDLARYARKEGALKGLYTPYWTFDAETESRYIGDRGIVVMVPRTMPTMVNGSMRMQTMMVPETRWTRVSGRVARVFDDVTVMASRNLPGDLARAIDRWRLSALVPYRADYLAGFGSEAYQVQLPDGFTEAQASMRRQIENDVRAHIGGQMQRIHRLETQYGDISFKHVLLPIWLAGYRFRGKAYQVVINGQTGQVEGHRPYSWVKISAAVLAGVVLVGGLYALTLLGGGGSAPPS